MTKFHFEIPELGYQFGDLAPMMSQQTLSFHYGKHFRTYVDNLNQLVDGSKYEGLSLNELVRKAPEGPMANNAGQVLGKDENGVPIRSGEIDFSVVSPFEMFPLFEAFYFFIFIFPVLRLHQVSRRTIQKVPAFSKNFFIF